MIWCGQMQQRNEGDNVPLSLVCAVEFDRDRPFGISLLFTQTDESVESRGVTHRFHGMPCHVYSPASQPPPFPFLFLCPLLCPLP